MWVWVDGRLGEGMIIVRVGRLDTDHVSKESMEGKRRGRNEVVPLCKKRVNVVLTLPGFFFHFSC